MRAESLTEEIDGGHLATEQSLLVQLRRGPNVALVERLLGIFVYRLFIFVLLYLFT